MNKNKKKRQKVSNHPASSNQRGEGGAAIVRIIFPRARNILWRGRGRGRFVV